MNHDCTLPRETVQAPSAYEHHPTRHFDAPFILSRTLKSMPETAHCATEARNSGDLNLVVARAGGKAPQNRTAPAEFAAVSCRPAAKCVSPNPAN